MAFFEIVSVGDDLILKNKYGIYSKKELEAQLEEGHLTVEELGEIYKLNVSKVHNVFKSLGITYRNTVGDTRIFNSTITPEMHQVILGTLLGDAFMKIPKRYQCAHGLHQYEYLYHIAGKLYPFISCVGDRDVSHSDVLKSFFMWTHNHPSFIPYFNRFYSRGRQKKFINHNSVDGLTPEGLGYWYMDDGKLGENPSLCVGNIPNESGELLIRYLFDVFNLHCTFQCQNIEKGYYNVYVRAESKSHFFELISPYIIPLMRYKLGEGSRIWVDFNSRQIASEHYQLCEKANRSIRYSGDKAVLEELRKYPPIRDFKQKYIEEIKERILKGNQVSTTESRKILPTKDELYRLLKEGSTDKQIGFLYGVSRETIGRLRRREGL